MEQRRQQEEAQRLAAEQARERLEAEQRERDRQQRLAEEKRQREAEAVTRLKQAALDTARADYAAMKRNDLQAAQSLRPIRYINSYKQFKNGVENCAEAEILSLNPEVAHANRSARSGVVQPHPPRRLAPLESGWLLPAERRGSIRRVSLPPGDKRIALTFDLCEMASDVTGYDAELIAYLRKEGIHATFYAGGKWMRSHPEQTKQLMVDPLFELGNHAWTHVNLHLGAPRRCRPHRSQVWRRHRKALALPLTGR